MCRRAGGETLAGARGAADARAADGIDATVGDVRVAKPLDDAMLADAAGHPAVVTIEDGYCDGGIGSAIAARLGECDGAVPRIATLGVPVRFIPHGKPDAILASLGLDLPLGRPLGRRLAHVHAPGDVAAVADALGVELGDEGCDGSGVAPGREECGYGDVGAEVHGQRFEEDLMQADEHVVAGGGRPFSWF